MFFKKLNGALGKYRTKFLLNQMRQTGIKHWRVVRKISWTRPVTSLGHQGGRRVFWEGPKFLKLCPTHFSRGWRKKLQGVLISPGYGPAWNIGKFFSCCFSLLFPEKAHNQTNALSFVWILFLEKVIVFENLKKALESTFPAWLPTARSIPVQSQILCDQTENRQLAVCCPVNRWKTIK